MKTKRLDLKKIALLFLIFAMLVCCLCACTNRQNATGSCTVVIGGEIETEYTVPLDKTEITEGLISVLDYLKNESSLDFTANESPTGAFLTQVGNVKQDEGAGVYIYIWTSVAKDHDVSEYATTKEYKGKTLSSVGVGASKMTIEDGAVIYIGTIKW